MKKLVIILVIALQQACAIQQPVIVDNPNVKKWECVIQDVNHATLKFIAVYDETTGIGYLQFGSKKYFTTSDYFSNASWEWRIPDVVVLIRKERVVLHRKDPIQLNGTIGFYQSGKNTRYLQAQCHEHL
jgi:hypothetical protein